MLFRSVKLAYSRWSSNTKSKELVRQLSESKFADAETMGRLLGKRLQVRNESRSTVYTHQRNGKIDKRLVHQLGFDAESVFNQTFIDKFKKANLHLSLDASSSMGGDKWERTVMNTIALAKAVSMIQNLSMQISIRYSDGASKIGRAHV